MELVSFLGDLLIKPDSDLAKFVSKTFKMLLICLLAFIIWKEVGGIVVTPKELSIAVAWDFVFSGQVLIPIVLVFSTDRIIRFTQGLLFPLLILGLRQLVRWELRRVGALYKKAIKNPAKRVIAVLCRIGLVSISSNKLKKGPLFRVYEAYGKGINMALASTEHLELLTLLCQIAIVWICLIKNYDSVPLSFRYTVTNILEFLIIYIPLNLATLYAVNDHREVLVQVVEWTRKLDNKLIADESSTNGLLNVSLLQ